MLCFNVQFASPGYEPAIVRVLAVVNVSSQSPAPDPLGFPVLFPGARCQRTVSWRSGVEVSLMTSSTIPAILLHDFAVVAHVENGGIECF